MPTRDLRRLLAAWVWLPVRHPTTWRTRMLSLRDIGVDPLDDPGTNWHPRTDKTGARDDDGHLVDLNDDQVAEHACKPEAAEQPDAGRVLAAEDSEHTAAGEV